MAPARRTSSFLNSSRLSKILYTEPPLANALRLHTTAALLTNLPPPLKPFLHTSSATPTS